MCRQGEERSDQKTPRSKKKANNSIRLPNSRTPDWKKSHRCAISFYNPKSRLIRSVHPIHNPHFFFFIFFLLSSNLHSFSASSSFLKPALYTSTSVEDPGRNRKEQKERGTVPKTAFLQLRRRGSDRGSVYMYVQVHGVQDKMQEILGENPYVYIYKSVAKGPVALFSSFLYFWFVFVLFRLNRGRRRCKKEPGF